MTRSDLERDAEAGRAAPVPQLPLVSVVVVNFNYGRFLGEALASVRAQDYPRVECILVDNASTDGSDAVIAAAVATWPDLVVVRRAENGGQTAAAFDGLARARGAYVVFLDADDTLLPHCLRVHMAVHLSTRVHVGFTCADMLQVRGDGEVVLTTNEPMATYLRDGGTPRSATPGLLRPTRAGLGALWDGFDPDLPNRVHLVGPRQKHWVWAPTSGTCFRRDALALFADTVGAAELRTQTDLFLAFGLNAVCGSILIDEPLFSYRLHGGNAFTSRAQLAGFLSFDPVRTADNTALARRLLVEQMVGRVDRFVAQRWQGFAFLRALHHVDRRDSSGSFAATAIARAPERFAGQVGPWLTALFLLGKRGSARALGRVLRLALGGGGGVR